MTEAKDQLLEKVLAQNERLLDAVLRMAEAQSPVEIIRALNSVVVPRETPVDPWGEDPPRGMGADAWGDPDVPFDAFVPEAPVPGSREDEEE